MNPADKETLRHRAAAYVRMSTDHQQYSTSNQMDFIREDARRRGLEIVKMFSDEGKSGLDFEGRDALKAMLAEIEAGQAGYGENVLNLTLTRAYVRKVLNNPAVAKFLTDHYADIFAEFTALAGMESL
jgi:hypothetical protein